jgi:hypothetical protein
MTAYMNLRARYSQGALELNTPLDLPEGAEVIVRVTLLPPRSRPRRLTRRLFTYPNRPLSPHHLAGLVGIVSLGGDALADSEAIYDNE